MKEILFISAKRSAFLVCLALLGGITGCARRAETPHRVTVAYAHRIVSLDPHAQDETTTTSVLASIYEPLVRLSPDLEVTPCLAESWTTPSPTRWQLRIRQGVFFHDGRRLTVDDVLGSLRRALHWPGSATASYLSTVSGIHRVPGEPWKIEITTSMPSPLLLTRLTAVAIVPSGFDPARPVGTGPYRVVSMSHNGSLVLQRWKSYWGIKPALATVRIEVVSSQEELARLVTSGAVDVVVPVSRAFLASHSVPHEYRVIEMRALTTTMLGFNLRRWPLGNARVREAIDRAIDRAALVKKAFPRGDAEPAVSYVPAGVFGFAPTCAVHRADPREAHRLLERAGVPPGTSIGLLVSTESAPAAWYIKTALEKAGLEAHVEVVPYDVLYGRLLKGDLDSFVVGWNFPFADSSDFLEAMIHSRQPRLHLGLQNGMGYANAAVDGWIERVPAAATADARHALVQNALRQLCTDRPLIPLYHLSRHILVKKPFTVAVRQGAWTFPQDIGVSQ
ncbi:MAG: hypothetical protein GXP48_05470 [Acidobacteria bacterium]|nr:hypothetical protein [Acidobacteriota bacterium]